MKIAGKNVWPRAILISRARLFAGLLIIWIAIPANAWQQLAALPFRDACARPEPPPPCRDSDGDGLCDEWEHAKRIPGGPALPDADPYRPDIYLKYDYMVAANHDHNPPAQAIQWMVDAFAQHGIAVHIDPEHVAIPEVTVTTLDPNPSIACTGPSFVTMQTLRQLYFGDRAGAYHYMVFAHRVTTPDLAHAAYCPTDPRMGMKPDPSSTGFAEIPGDDAIVSFGSFSDTGTQIGIEFWAATIMHEFGHNLGLDHGGTADATNYKPNYISVMNYAYLANGVLVSGVPGSVNLAACSADAHCGPPVLNTGACARPNACHCTDDLAPILGTNACFRLDFSIYNLPALNEFSAAPGIGGLDERVGIQGPASSTDLALYFVPGPSQLLAPINGTPIDWNNDGLISQHVTADINSDAQYTLLTTQNDWEQAGGQFVHLNFKFQCVDADAKTAARGESTLDGARRRWLTSPRR
jgi:hypothetical protein